MKSGKDYDLKEEPLMDGKQGKNKKVFAAKKTPVASKVVNESNF